MNATGNLRFTRRSDGSITHEWTGGRRIAITSELIKVLTGERPRIGQIINAHDVPLRIIAFEFAQSGQGYQDVFIAMREGRLARFIWRYWQWLSDNADSLFRWECKWLRWQMPVEGGDYPKWSLVGILARPLV